MTDRSPARIRRRSATRAMLVLLIGTVVVGTGPDGSARTGVELDRTTPTPGGRPIPPNILIVITDDQAGITFDRSVMPTVFEALADRGVLFTRAYVNTSLCCPSRSEILTGLYEHHTGVDSNNTDLARPTIVQALHGLGYRTLLSGKYLNSYHCAPPRPEFDRWVCFDSQGYVDPLLNVDGEWIRFRGYSSDILAGFVTDFIAETPRNQPFFALFAPKNPHLPANDDRCDGLVVEPYRPPSFDEDTEHGDKPEHMKRAPFTPQEIGKIDRHHRDMTQATACLDPAIKTVLSALGEREADTLVVYLSDNGYLYGEHRATGKLLPYEESVRVPFVVRYPALTAEGVVSDAIVQNVDIAPTIADLVGIPWGADGTSLVPLLTGDATQIREAALIELCQGLHYPCRKPPSFAGVATRDYKFVHFTTDERELYDLANDPYELDNLAGDPGWEGVEAELASMVEDLMSPPPTETTVVTGPSGSVPPGTYEFTYFSQSRFATYRCRLDRDGVQGTWFQCDGQATELGPLAPGSYVFLVAGTDENGMQDPTPARRQFAVSST